ncbi:glycosyltransferase family 4 protein [Paenibacillus sp. LPE1-1-1.1]|uniref:glycosyltransferase family 4 protein n=1 Tax=Paenibacillus sp. LPE1-1-1.1 TaxID=3135230 RepID=UPI00341C9BA7
MKKHILVISQYFYPEQFRINDICTEWVKRGYKVTVITGIPNYPQGKYYKGYSLFKSRRETYNDVDIIRIPLVARGSNSITLILNYLSFVVSGFIWKSITNVKADFVFIYEVSPMTQALPGIWYAMKRKIPCYLYVQDLWPENVAIITGTTNKWVLSSIGKMVDYIYSHCTKILTTSKSFVKSIENRGVSTNKIKFWPQYAEDFYKPMKKSEAVIDGEEKIFKVIFTGNIGNAQGLDILPKAAKIIKNEIGCTRKIHFTIVGEGRYKDTLLELIENNDVTELFSFIPKKPASEIPEILSEHDVAIICLTANPLFKMTIPAKLQSYMACGMPILASADGETANIVNESRSGKVCEVGNAKSFADTVVEMSKLSAIELDELQLNSRNYYENNFNKQDLLDEIDDLFQNTR